MPRVLDVCSAIMVAVISGQKLRKFEGTEVVGVG